MKKIFFENLDGLRFIAFLAIFLHHGFFTGDPAVRESTVFRMIELVIRPSGLGVPFFFCLSGFLITYLLLTERKDFSRIHLGKFYIRRILRIWPLYYAVIIFGFFIFPALRVFFIGEPYTETATLWKYLFYLSNFDQLNNGLPYGAGLGVTWSLSVEEQFYLFWPPVLMLIRPRYYAALTIGIFLMSTVCMQFFDFHYTHTIGSMSDLSIGAFIAVISHGQGRIFHRLSNMGRLGIFITYVLGIVHIYLFTVMGFGNRVLISAFMAFIIFEQCFCESSVVKMGRFKAISYLGTITYGLYLLHTISNFIIHNLIEGTMLNEVSPLFRDLLIQPASSVALTLFLGYLSYNYFEKPFLSLKSRYSLIITSTSR